MIPVLLPNSIILDLHVGLHRLKHSVHVIIHCVSLPRSVVILFVVVIYLLRAPFEPTSPPLVVIIVVRGMITVVNACFQLFKSLFAQVRRLCSTYITCYLLSFSDVCSLLWRASLSWYPISRVNKQIQLRRILVLSVGPSYCLVVSLCQSVPRHGEEQ